MAQAIGNVSCEHSDLTPLVLAIGEMAEETQKRVVVQYGTRTEIVSFNSSEGVFDSSLLIEAARPLFKDFLPHVAMAVQVSNKEFGEWIDVEKEEDSITSMSKLSHVSENKRMLVVLEAGQVENLPGVLLGAFFVFNISYPKSLKPFYLLLENILLEKPSEKMPATVKVILNSLRHV